VDFCIVRVIGELHSLFISEIIFFKFFSHVERYTRMQFALQYIEPLVSMAATHPQS
jgi:hypothetical protein